MRKKQKEECFISISYARIDFRYLRHTARFNKTRQSHKSNNRITLMTVFVAFTFYSMIGNTILTDSRYALDTVIDQHDCSSSKFC